MFTPLRDQVEDLLERYYYLNFNAAEKVIDLFWEEGFLPAWYFVANSAEDIARHVYTMSQLLTAQTESLREVSDDGLAITYMLSVGYDFPGKLVRVLRQNLDMSISSFDSVKTKSGVSIVSLERPGRIAANLTASEIASLEELKKRLLSSARDGLNKQACRQFTSTLTYRYLREEKNAPSEFNRAVRHMTLCAESWDSSKPAIRSESAGDGTIRTSIAFANPSLEKGCKLLDHYQMKNRNIIRAYYDVFSGNPSLPDMGVLSAYTIESVEVEEIAAIAESFDADENDHAAHETHRRIELGLRTLSNAEVGSIEAQDAVDSLTGLAKENIDPERTDDSPVFIINALSDFLRAAEVCGVAESQLAMHYLLGFEAFDEFWVERILDTERSHIAGYRTKHSTVRGPSKGGMRIDPIVEFSEVSALAFMMTWKCARVRLLFGGGKGGLILNPQEYRHSGIDFFDTLGGFGRSTFLVTGPIRDVPAGDVGCGAEEIGYMFEGFKSALSDLARTAYGIKHGVARIGNRLISTDKAREILDAHFGIDYHDRDLLRCLVADEHYLELVAAAHITGKPKMGIVARTGATGRGIVYSILAAVGRLYIDGEWRTDIELNADEKLLLQRSAEMGQRYFTSQNGASALTEEEWNRLHSSVYPQLLGGARVVIQGAGKVGSSVMRELERYNVHIVAVADRDGAVIGSNLPVDALIESVKSHGSVIHCSDGVDRVIEGSREGAEVLTLECDILVPAALEHAITSHNASAIQAPLVVCGSNGPITARAAKTLHEKGCLVVYDFLANSGGVTASYFEWLRNLYERYRFEAEVIRNSQFDPSIMEDHIMPEFRERVLGILADSEGKETTSRWNSLIRDMIFGAINDDMRTAKSLGITLKSAGFIDSELRVLAATLAAASREKRNRLWDDLPGRTKGMLRDYLRHPEIELFGESLEELEEG